MPRFTRRATGFLRLAFVAFPLALAGCGEASPLERSGIVGLTPPSTWTRVEPARFMVPGTPLAAWSGPSGASLVVFRTLPAPRVEAKGLIEELKTRLDHLPEMRLVESSTVKIGETEAARVDLTALGTGDALAPTGLGRAMAPEGKVLVPTHRVSLGVPRPSETLWLVWHYPESSQASLAPEVEAMIQGISFRTVQASSSY